MSVWIFHAVVRRGQQQREELAHTTTTVKLRNSVIFLNDDSNEQIRHTLNECRFQPFIRFWSNFIAPFTSNNKHFGQFCPSVFYEWSQSGKNGTKSGRGFHLVVDPWKWPLTQWPLETFLWICCKVKLPLGAGFSKETLRSKDPWKWSRRWPLQT